MKFFVNDRTIYIDVLYRYPSPNNLWRHSVAKLFRKYEDFFLCVSFRAS